MRRLHIILGLIAASILASSGRADISYSYIATLATQDIGPAPLQSNGGDKNAAYSVQNNGIYSEAYANQIKLNNGQSVILDIWLQEIDTSTVGFVQSVGGLISGGFGISRAGATGDGGANITKAIGDVNISNTYTTNKVTYHQDYSGAFFGNGTPFPAVFASQTGPVTTFAGTNAISTTAKNGTQVYFPGTIGNNTLTWVRLGQITITGGANDTTFILGAGSASKGNTLTFSDQTGGQQNENRLNLDDTAAAKDGVNPAYTGARNTTFQIQIINPANAVPEPSSIILGGFTVGGMGFSWMRRRRLAKA